MSRMTGQGAVRRRRTAWPKNVVEQMREQMPMVVPGGRQGCGMAASGAANDARRPRRTDTFYCAFSPASCARPAHAGRLRSMTARSTQ